MRLLRVLIVILSIFTVSGCVTTVERGVKDNLFYSNYLPKIKIKIGKNLVYDVNQKFDGVTFCSNIGGNLHESEDIFKFESKDGSQDIYATITVSKLDDGYYYLTKKYGEEIISSEYIYIKGKEYLDIIGVSNISGNCWMYRFLVRVVGMENDHILNILYIYNISKDKQVINCSGWGEKDRLTPEQLAIYNSFIEDYNRDIEIDID